ncbi:MAG: hypothetical protein ACRDKA_06330 [Actinomycetota bacterium]
MRATLALVVFRCATFVATFFRRGYHEVYCNAIQSVLQFFRAAADGEGGLLRIDELVWDDWNEEHIGRRDIRQEEVEEAVFDSASFFVRTRREGVVRYLVTGLTEAGRYLFVVLEPLSGNRAYVVTARDMTDGEKRRFKKRGR